jgi:hypothetical protein
VLISSRSFEEYVAMLDLATTDLAGRTVVDIAGGGSDFVAAAAALGAHASALDPAYTMRFDELSARLRENTRTGLAIVDDHAAAFVWDWYGDRETRDRMRSRSAGRFLADRSKNPGRYLAGALPRLPLRDGAADLVLCSHLLFTWSDVLDHAWHRDAIGELTRIGAEVRVFPLVVQATGEAVPWLPDLCEELRDAGHAVEQRQVPYEFQAGADRMLVVTSGHGSR